MRYMTLYQPDEESTEPPAAEHLARMGKLIELARHFLEVAGSGQTEVRPMQPAPDPVPA